MILLACVFTMAMCFALDKSAFISNENENKMQIPPTWNLDWQGGPGFDRFKIINEKGPYNPNGFD